jgi:hypothetical protein
MKTFTILCAVFSLVLFHGQRGAAQVRDDAPLRIHMIGTGEYDAANPGVLQHAASECSSMPDEKSSPSETRTYDNLVNTP